MKTRQLVLAAVMLVASATLSQAQTLESASKPMSAAEKHQIEMRYVRALGMTNNGVVESALALVAKLKLDHPEEEFSMIMKEVSYLAAHSKVPMIRYKASLTESVFFDPVPFKEAAAERFTDPDAFFSALVDRSATPSLSAN